MRGIPDEAAHYHILDLEVWGLIFDPMLGWQQSNEDSGRNTAAV
jgi:hypothetical protein